MTSISFTSYAFAEEKDTTDCVTDDNALRTLSYDEFKLAINEEQSVKSASVKKSSNEGISLDEISDTSYSLEEFKSVELAEDFYAVEYREQNESENEDDTYEELLRTNPTPSLLIYVNNIDSLKNGEPTTDTVLLWIYNDTDPDGNTIVSRFLDGFPTGYILGSVTNNNNEEIGFATRFFNPGTYTINYYITDSNQESNGISYILDIQSVADYSVYTGDLSTSTEIDSYIVPIDFSSISTAVICFVQSGETDLIVTIEDEQNSEVTRMSSSNRIARRWYFIDKPTGVNGVYNFTVSVAVYNNDFHSGSSSYRIMAGSKNDTEEMLSYVDGAVLLGKYTATDDTYDFRTGYTPNIYESYYKFTADGPATVTVMTNHSETRFRILVASSMAEVYNSENDNDAHRTGYTSPFSNIEKQRLAFVSGVDYYLVVYANTPISTNFVADNITLTQGMGVLRSGRNVFTATGSITAGTSGYSSSATIPIYNGIPANTAEVKSVEFVSSDGVMLSDIKSFRVKAQSGLTTWQNSVQYHMTINYPYTADGSNNTPLVGDWLYGFQAALSPKTMTPKIAVNYEYEYGD